MQWQFCDISFSIACWRSNETHECPLYSRNKTTTRSQPDGGRLTHRVLLFCQNYWNTLPHPLQNLCLFVLACCIQSFEFETISQHQRPFFTPGHLMLTRVSNCQNNVGFHIPRNVHNFTGLLYINEYYYGINGISGRTFPLRMGAGQVTSKSMPMIQFTNI